FSLRLETAAQGVVGMLEFVFVVAHDAGIPGAAAEGKARVGSPQPQEHLQKFSRCHLPPLEHLKDVYLSTFRLLELIKKCQDVGRSPECVRRCSFKSTWRVVGMMPLRSW